MMIQLKMKIHKEITVVHKKNKKAGFQENFNSTQLCIMAFQCLRNINILYQQGPTNLNKSYLLYILNWNLNGCIYIFVCLFYYIKHIYINSTNKQLIYNSILSIVVTISIRITISIWISIPTTATVVCSINIIRTISNRLKYYF